MNTNTLTNIIEKYNNKYRIMIIIIIIYKIMFEYIDRGN